MNAQKICFIMCANDDLYKNECISYLERLDLPDGFEREMIVVEGASSMTSGYNQAMKQSDAKYKVYLHQDVFVLNTNFIHEIVRLFENPQIGMIGMVGSLEVEKTGIMWYGTRVGMLHSNSVCFADSYLFGNVEGEYQSVQAVDGLLMATQYDIPWREDLFRGWDFYDISQSMEFRRKGYQVIVPHTDSPWCIHDDGLLNLQNYYAQREIFLKEYLEGKRSEADV